jgi:hypothetical protein
MPGIGDSSFPNGWSAARVGLLDMPLAYDELSVVVADRVGVFACGLPGDN